MSAAERLLCVNTKGGAGGKRHQASQAPSISAEFPILLGHSLNSHICYPRMSPS